MGQHSNFAAVTSTQLVTLAIFLGFWATALGSMTVESEQALVIHDPASTPTLSPEDSNENTIETILPEVYFLHVHSDIRHRYSRTRITSRVANTDDINGHEVTFSVVLPETAFISKFIMEIDGVPYESYVKEKEEARKDYAQAQSQGQSAGLVEKSTRNSNLFNVNVHLKPNAKATFNLTYEELLQRRVGLYEQVINVNPEQMSKIKDYKITMNIEESRYLTEVHIPSVDNNLEIRDETTVIVRRTPNEAHITWTPPTTEFSNMTGTQFVVQYDVDRDKNAGQILVRDGYFVHFFAPENLPPVRKHVVFVLDISGSMVGRKLEQMKEAQLKILDDMSEDDHFNIITFSTGVDIWFPPRHRGKQSLPATPYNILKAKNDIARLSARGATNIHDALIEAIKLTRVKSAEESNVQSLIVFLTDGDPTVGITVPQQIQELVRAANRNLSVPIFSLAFGKDVEFLFLKKLSLQNFGFARKIYEASDAVLQLKGFYHEISSPLLSNVAFNYTNNQEYSVKNVTVSKFNKVFKGGEVAVAGKLEWTGHGIASVGSRHNNALRDCHFKKANISYFAVDVTGVGRDGEMSLGDAEFYETVFACGVPTSAVEKSGDNFLERLWAYLTIQQLLDSDLAAPEKPGKTFPQTPVPIEELLERDHDDVEASSKTSISFVNLTHPETPRQQALRLALQYGFVTPLTSLVVVKPDNSDVAGFISTDEISESNARSRGKGLSVSTASMPNSSSTGIALKANPATIAIWMVLVSSLYVHDFI